MDLRRMTERDKRADDKKLKKLSAHIGRLRAKAHPTAQEDKGNTPPWLTEQQKAEKDILDQSSQQNRNLLFSFIFLCIYLLITLGGIEDKDFILPNSRVILPIFGLGISIKGFFFFAPIMLLALRRA